MKNKDRIKELELQLSCLTALLAEYVIKEVISRIPIPDYSKGSKGGLAIVNEGNEKEVVLPPIINYNFIKDESTKTEIDKYFDHISQQKQAKEQ